MVIRPVRDQDICPVLSSSDMYSGVDAVMVLLNERLELYAGEWWENPAWGCELFSMLTSGRITEQDTPTLSSYLSSYIAATPGVLSVEDVQASVAGRRVSYSCRVLTEYGYGSFVYEYGV